MKFELYQDRKKEWRWKLTGKNGKRVCSSSEGFKRRAVALQNAHLVALAFAGALWGVK